MQQVATLNMVNKTKTTYAKMIFIYVCNYEASPVHLYITEDPKPSFEGDLECPPLPRMGRTPASYSNKCPIIAFKFT